MRYNLPLRLLNQNKHHIRILWGTTSGVFFGGIDRLKQVFKKESRELISVGERRLTIHSTRLYCHLYISHVDRLASDVQPLGRRARPQRELSRHPHPRRRLTLARSRGVNPHSCCPNPLSFSKYVFLLDLVVCSVVTRLYEQAWAL